MDIITEQLMKARAEAGHFEDLYEETLATLRAVAADADDLRMWVMYAAAGSLCVGVAAGAIAGSVVARQRYAAGSTRLLQEMQDSQRRAASELKRSQRFGGESLAKSLIPALDAMDAMDTAMATIDTASVVNADEIAAMVEGSRLTRSLLADALQKNGITRIDPGPGDKFDVASMEAMFTAPTAERDASGLVAQILRPGYVLHEERVLRPAQVGVSVHGDDEGAGK